MLMINLRIMVGYWYKNWLKADSISHDKIMQVRFLQVMNQIRSEELFLSFFYWGKPGLWLNETTKKDKNSYPVNEPADNHRTVTFTLQSKDNFVLYKAADCNILTQNVSIWTSHTSFLLTCFYFSNLYFPEWLAQHQKNKPEPVP